jgi:hypothetical protein
MVALRSTIIMLGVVLACTYVTIPIKGEYRSTVEERGATTRVPETCPVTKPSDPPFVPPSPYPTKPGLGSFWFGTDKLWTILRTDAKWSQGEKTFWWRQDWGRYQWVPTENGSKLTVAARRLDAAAPAPKVSKATSSYREQDWKSFLVGGIDFPTPGCWEITGHYEDGDLRFVVWVIAR